MIRVHKDAGDWTATCDTHHVSTCCTDWELALEAAYGHAAMQHKRHKPMFEVWVSDGHHSMHTIGISQ